ncbi:membrane protein [Acrocarpospora phusangensis]|uniref:Membrane protein n=1 Tax=Acrocarpospora phusangensis TaxID=1070424 RepID=A0A919Q6G6_9ACTN|nr:MMPL family transporter [Acrocarpospora phusangensis]GIH23036.1 membrane protein [Acrocarpospora phusangensis]
MILRALTRWVLRHRRLVTLTWLLLTVAGAIAVTPATEAMTPDFGALPGRPGYETNQRVLRDYGNGGAADPVLLVVTAPPGVRVDTPAAGADLGRALGLVERAVGEVRAVSYAATGDRGLVSADGRTTFALVYPPASAQFPPYAAAIPRMERALAGVRVAGAPVRVTGTDALFIQSSEASGPGLLAETLIAGVGALVVLAVVFGSVLAVLPLVMAAMAVLVTFLAVWGLTGVMEVSFVVQFLVGLIGLGVAIDYSLLITTRWREERAAGAGNEAAVERAMATAGSAVVLSGVTVAVALAAMIVLPVPFLRAMGVGGLLIPLFSVLVTVTLLPVLLASLGTRLDWPYRNRRPSRPARRWTAWAAAVVRRPVAAALLAAVALGALILPVGDLRLGAPVPASMASSGTARATLDDLGRAGFGQGVLSPEYVLVEGGDPARAVQTAREVPGVRAVLADPAWRRAGTSLVAVLVDEPAAAGETRERLRAALAEVPGARVGGAAAQGRDFVEAVYGVAPLPLAMILLVTLVLLVRAFRSLLLAVKAVVLNALSVAATFGLVVLAWQQGLLSEALWGIEATGALTEWVPVMVFAFLFGLSMDYEVFILARIREEYDATGSTAEAAVRGVARTGRLVTSAALILFLAFVSLAATPGTEVKIFATALGLGILLDATVVRALLVPALVVLFGRGNWWLPRPLVRLLLVGERGGRKDLIGAPPRDQAEHR